MLSRHLLIAAAALTVGSLAEPAALADASPVAIRAIRVDTKEKKLGAGKGRLFLGVILAVELDGKVAAHQTVRVRARCDVGPRTVGDEIHAVGARLDAMTSGSTKTVEVPLFYGNAFERAPERCEINLTLKLPEGREGRALGAFCWQGGWLRDGRCTDAGAPG